MSISLPTKSRTVKRSLMGAVSILAIVPFMYFAACSSGGDDSGGGGSTPPPSNNTPTGSANQFAYVTSAGTSEIQAFAVDGSGNLTPIGGKINTGNLPHHVNVSSGSKFVYVSNHESNFLSGWRINTDGSLAPMNPATGSPVTTDASPHSSVTDTTGSFLYVVSAAAPGAPEGPSTVQAYKLDGNGIPTPISGTNSWPAGTHGHNIAISPNNQFVYVAAEGSDEVLAYSRDTGTGALTPRGSVGNMDLCTAVTVSNDSRFVYAAYSNAVNVFSINADGSLTPIAPTATFSTNNNGFGSEPHSVALHPNGLTLYTANLNPNPGRVSVFGVNTTTGALNELQPNPAPATASGPGLGMFPNYVVVHPNGQVLFTANQGDSRAGSLDTGSVSRFTVNGDGTLVSPATLIPNTGAGTNAIGTTKF
jgi:6-phosphogluconolactonase (cycloisomerase 2 family)